MMLRKVRRIKEHCVESPEMSSETARDGAKNFDQIYTYIQEVAKSTLNHFCLWVYSDNPCRGHEPNYPPRDNQGH